MTTTQGFDGTAIGRWSDPVEFPITRDRLRAYAAATNDPIEPHRAGHFASPVFASVPAYASTSRALIGVMPGHLLTTILPGAQDFHFHAPLLPDTTVVTRSAAIGMRNEPSGVSVTVEAQTHADDGRLLVKQFLTSCVRYASVAQAVGSEPPAHTLDDTLRDQVPDAVVAQTFDRDQTFRYAEASGDPLPIYTDEELARSMGLPGIVVHGLCAMAFASVAVIRHTCPEEPTRLKRLAARFSDVVRPGATVTTRIWDTGSVPHAFETESDEGAVVMTDGLAEVVS
jgi:acyl dehydratase